MLTDADVRLYEGSIKSISVLILLHLQDAIDEGAARVYRRSAAAAGLSFFSFFSFFQGSIEAPLPLQQPYQGSIKALSRLYQGSIIQTLIRLYFCGAFLLLRRCQGCQGSISDAEEALSCIKALKR